MSAIDISSLPISKIKSALKDLGLSGSGTKKELIERYNEYMKNPEKKVDGKEAEVAMDDAAVSNVETSERGVEQSGGEVGLSGSGVAKGDGNGGVEGGATEVDAADAVADPAATEAPSTLPTAAETPSTQPTATEPTPAPTNAVNADIPQPSPSIDIEAELTRREERAKRFGGAFDRERCRQQLLKTQQQSESDHLRETRRARFGAGDAAKPLETPAEPTTAVDPVRAARIAKFGQVDMSRFQRKRSQPQSHGRKSRRFH